VRQNLNTGTKEAAIEYFNKTFGVNFSTEHKTLLIIGGSLGARTINQSIIAHLPELINSGVQVIWQTGKYYFEDCKQALNSQLSTLNSQLSALNSQPSTIICTDFISQMPDAYALADLVISRAGASSISELCLLGKPSILVPSPNVAEDHQTHNAMALVNKQAAVLVKDIDAHTKLVSTALQLIENEKTLQDLHTNILTLALPDSAKLIAQEVIKLTKQ
jgi:UDP-N-acetylglucosamine--N-acetylmuramyl-(pentapeptide) pyrophosphoryl-undecaprenol N-acetylglucosamine transferase